MPTFHVPASNLRRTHLTLTLALILVTALGIFFVRELIDLQTAMDKLRDNDAARIEMSNVLVDLLDAETGQRGFILTGQETYLDPYYRGKNRIRESIREPSNRPARKMDASQIFRKSCCWQNRSWKSSIVPWCCKNRAIPPAPGRSCSEATANPPWTRYAGSSSATSSSCGCSGTRPSSGWMVGCGAPPPC
jgi:hypothetical protein